MKIDISDNDFATLCICAIRYCQGRRTYMPSLVQGIVSELLKHLPDNDIRVMIKYCEFQENMQLYGDELIDKPGWIKWKEKLVAEEKRRSGND